jgi:hypothetical protein
MLLAAAQAQADEEAEIERRLPREVLNITKRLDRQQQSVDDLHGNISKLTDMVAQLGLSMRSSGSEPQQVRSEFHTPPHLPTHLSPIIEGGTPVMTPEAATYHNRQQIHYSTPPPETQPHPTQIPQPSFIHTAHTSQPYANPPPFPTQTAPNQISLPHSSHIHHTTNPATHPHQYHPNFNTFPSHPMQYNTQYQPQYQGSFYRDQWQPIYMPPYPPPNYQYSQPQQFQPQYTYTQPQPTVHPNTQPRVVPDL